MIEGQQRKKELRNEICERLDGLYVDDANISHEKLGAIAKVKGCIKQGIMPLDIVDVTAFILNQTTENHRETLDLLDKITDCCEIIPPGASRTASQGVTR